MSPELQDRLSAKYPKIFSNLTSPELPPSCSLDCGDGWYWLIERLCHCVQDLVDQQGLTQHVAQHVKEKFGGLRFYWYFSDDQVDAMTEFAEALSHFACGDCGDCGDCGAPAVRNTDGWMHTTCGICQSAAKTPHKRDTETCGQSTWKNSTTWRAPNPSTGKLPNGPRRASILRFSCIGTGGTQKR
jgi:hypothetical protein